MNLPNISDFALPKFEDRTNNDCYRFLASRKGLIISTEFQISAKIRRPNLWDVNALDGLPMVPAAGPALDNIMREIYGCSILQPLSSRFRNKGFIPIMFYGPIWESRPQGEWLRLSKKFKFNDVIVPRSMKLNLKLIFQNEKLSVYTID